MQGVILLISARIEKAPMTCFSSLYSFIQRFYRLLIVSGGVNLVWCRRSFVAGREMISARISSINTLAQNDLATPD